MVEIQLYTMIDLLINKRLANLFSPLAKTSVFPNRSWHRYAIWLLF